MVWKIRLNPYALAIFASAAAANLTQALSPQLGENPTLLFWLAVALSRVYGGLRPGLVATGLSVGCLSFFYLPPLYAWTIARPEDQIELGIFCLAAVIFGVAKTDRLSLWHSGDAAADSPDLKDSTPEHLAQTQPDPSVPETLPRLNEEVTLGQYERIICAVVDGIVLIDRNYCYRFVNPTYLVWLNRAAEAVIGRSMQEILGDKLFLEIIQPRLDRALAGESIQHEHWAEVLSVKRRFFSVRYAPYVETDGTISGVVVSVRDLTTFKQTEEALQSLNADLEQRVQERTIALEESETTFRQLAENIQKVFCIEDMTGQVVYVSPSYTQIWGLPVADLYRNPSAWVASVHPDDRDRVMAQTSDIQNHFDQDLEYRIIRPDGEVRWICDRSFPIYNAEGELYRIAGIAEDMTERQQAAQALRRSQELFEAVFQESADAIFLVDPHSAKIVDCNQRAIDLFAADRKEDLIGLQGNALHKDPLPQEDWHQIRQDLASQGFWAQEIEYRTLKGRHFWGSLAAKDIQVGGHSMHLVRVTDISARKQAELDLHQQAAADQLLAKIAQTINQSAQLDQVLESCLEQIRQFLQSDRVIVCRFNPDHNVVIELEAVSAPELSLIGKTIVDPCFGQEWAERYRQGYLTVRSDTQAEDMVPCYAEFLVQMQIRANLVVGILQADQIWGLLIVHQCTAGRQWQSFEIDLCKQLGLQIGIASQKASLYTQLESELVIRRHTEQTLAQQVQWERLLRTISQQIRQSLRLEEILDTTVTEIRGLLQADRAVIFRLNSDRSGKVIQESKLDDCPTIAEMYLSDEHFPQESYEFYLHGQARAVPQADADTRAPCLAEFMEQIGVKSKVIAPILQRLEDDGLIVWGLLILHACTKPRHWQVAEVSLLQQLATQVGIALQQADLYAQLEKQLAQKEILLKEVHHRVKNNLQVVSSMLWLQSKAANHPIVSSALVDTRHRLQAMALIHETLYQSSDLGQLNFHDYIQRLGNSVLAANSIRPNQITLTYRLQPVTFNLETAIPCGLLLNELMTNAIKHAFTNQKKGEVLITLEKLVPLSAEPSSSDSTVSNEITTHTKAQTAIRYVLTIKDNGQGIPADLDLRKIKSLGLKIAYDLALQLRGTLKLERSNGTQFQLTFSALEYRKRF